MCGQWVKCLSDEQQSEVMQNLKTFMEVALAEPSGTVSATTTNADNCIDPAVDDPEQLQCNCCEVAMKSCQCSPCSPEEKATCLKTYMCGKESICQKWKESHCEPELIELAMARRVHKEWANF